MNKKKLLAIALAVCLIAILSFSSLAWFSDADEVTNTFHVATSDDPADPDDIFSVDVLETIDSNGNNKLDDEDETVGEGDSTTGQKYENITPGGEYVKAPYVVNTGAYNQWVRVKVSLSEAGAWQQIMQKHNLTDLSTIFLGHDETKWTRVEEPTLEGDTLTYTYYYHDVLKPGEENKTPALFTHVKFPNVLTQDDLALIGDGNFGLTIKAEAVQSDNLGEEIKTAKAAFDLVGQSPTFG